MDSCRNDIRDKEIKLKVTMGTVCEFPKIVYVEIMLNFGNCFRTLQSKDLEISFMNYVSSLLSMHYSAFFLLVNSI